MHHLDLKALQKDLTDEVLNLLRKTVDPKDEFNVVLLKISEGVTENLVEAISLNRSDLVAELVGQTKAVLELKRIHTTNEGWETFQATLGLIVRVALKAIGAVVIPT